jgi:hypothetical protein
MKKTILLLCTASLLASCIQDSEALFESAPVEVTFSVSGTRAADATWTAGDAVGVYILPAGGDDLSTATASNRKYTVAANGTMTLAEGNTLYYPINGTGVRFMAYYPYNKLSFDFADQSDKTKKEAVDFCFHRGTANYSRTSPATSLAFTHKFSKLLINISRGTNGPSCTGIKMTLSKVPAAATVDLAVLAAGEAGAITTSGVTTINAYTKSSSENTAVVEAIVPPHSGGGDYAYRVFTLTTGGEDKVCMLPNDLTFEAGKVYTFTFVLAAAGLAPSPPATQVPDGMTNCYIVAPGKSVEFPVSRAYAYENGDFTTTLRVGDKYTGDFGAAVVWDDNSVIYGTPTVTGTYTGAVVRVRTYNNIQGNAVVKIYKAADTGQTPVWSYHIWVTDYDPAVNTWTNNSFTFMDRNLGATEAGLTVAARGFFYQWGRKDLFLPASAPVVATDAKVGTVVYSIQNPDKFITSAGDWLYTRDGNLWGHGSVKTVYDPCPAGWRVPVNSNMSESTNPWYGVPAQNFTEGTGVNWGTNALYPATGYRDYNNGSPAAVGSGGTYWTASPYNSSSGSTSGLIFAGSVVYAYYDSPRAYGFSVRCVRE